MIHRHIVSDQQVIIRVKKRHRFTVDIETTRDIYIYVRDITTSNKLAQSNLVSGCVATARSGERTRPLRALAADECK